MTVSTLCLNHPFDLMMENGITFPRKEKGVGQGYSTKPTQSGRRIHTFSHNFSDERRVPDQLVGYQLVLLTF